MCRNAGGLHRLGSDRRKALSRLRWPIVRQCPVWHAQRHHGSRAGLMRHIVPRNAGCQPSFRLAEMPGMIGASIPAFTQASRKRKNVSASKKNWVMAAVAPASSLRLSQVDVCGLVCGVRMLFGICTNADVEFAGVSQGRDQIDGTGKPFGMGSKQLLAPWGASPRKATMSRTPASA